MTLNARMGRVFCGSSRADCTLELLGADIARFVCNLVVSEIAAPSGAHDISRSTVQRLLHEAGTRMRVSRPALRPASPDDLDALVASWLTRARTPRP